MTYARHAIGLLVLFAVPMCSYAEETISPSSMQGTWELVEWVHEGQTLKPPQVQARLSSQNGVSMFIGHRETDDGWLSIYGYGPYSFDRTSFSYGYDLQIEVTKEGEKISTSRRTTPVWRLVGHQDGGRYILAGEGGWGFVLEGDSMSYFEDGQTLRSYRRVEESVASDEERGGQVDPDLKGLRDWFDGYAALWLEPKLSDVPAIVNHFVTPIHFVDESGVKFISSQAELVARYTQLLENYSGDLLLVADAQLLSEQSARVDADWMELDQDRNPKGCFGRSYSLVKQDDWKISGFSLRDCLAASRL